MLDATIAIAIISYFAHALFFLLLFMIPVLAIRKWIL